MEFHGRFVLAKLSPRKKREAQIDSHSIESVNRLIEFEPERFVAVKISGRCDQHLAKIGIDSPIAHGVGVSQGVARDETANTDVIKLGGLGSQACFDISKTLAIGELGKS